VIASAFLAPTASRLERAGGRAASAADLKFLHHPRQARL